MPKRLVILSNHTLFAEGIASRLRQYPERVETHFVNPQQADYLAQIKQICPSAVIIDAADTDSTQCCLLCDLLMALVNVTLIRIEVQSKDIQLISSSQHPLAEVRDIIDIVERSNQMLG